MADVDMQAGQPGTDKRKRRAIAIARKQRRIYPYDQYGVVHWKRGHDDYRTFGRTWKEADQTQKANRRQFGYYGRGDYQKGGFTRAFRTFGRRLVGMGLSTADRAARGLQRQAEGQLSVRGLGDYHMPAANQLMAGASDRIPLMVNSSGDLTGDVYFSHREFVQNITVTMSGAGQSPFVVKSFPLNAGMQNTFPWLSQIAQNFVLYEFQGLVFEYVPTSGEYGSSSSNALGKVIMATQYDPTAPAFGSAIQMCNYDYAQTIKPSQGAIHGVETKPSQRSVEMMYVRTGVNAKDKIFTDLGNFQIATEGIAFSAAGTAVIGELWVSYKIKLSRANIFGAILGNNIGQDSFYAATVAAGTNFGNSVTRVLTENFANSFNLNVVPTYALPKLSNSIGGTLQAINDTVCRYTFPPEVLSGAYSLELMIIYDAAPASTRDITNSVTQGCTSATNATILDNSMGLYNCIGRSAMTTTETTLKTTSIVNVNVANDQPATVVWTLSTGTWNGNAGRLVLRVTELCTSCSLP